MVAGTRSGVNRSIFAVYADPSGPTAPRVSLSFGAFSKDVDAATIESFVLSLEETEEVSRTAKAARDTEFGGYPNIPINGSLAKPGVADALLEAMNKHLAPNLS